MPTCVRSAYRFDDQDGQVVEDRQVLVELQAESDELQRNFHGEQHPSDENKRF